MNASLSAEMEDKKTKNDGGTPSTVRISQIGL